jgi:hypothetical protein
MPCSIEAKPSALWTPSSPASPSNGLTAREEMLPVEAANALGCSNKRSMLRRDILEHRPPEVSNTRRYDQGVVSQDTTSVMQRSPYALAVLLLHVMRHNPRPDAICRWPEFKSGLPLMKSWGGEEKWPERDAVSMKTTSTNPRLPEVPVADVASALGQWVRTIASGASENTIMPCSSRVESSAPKAIPFASPSNGLGFRLMKSQGDGEDSLIEAMEELEFNPGLPLMKNWGGEDKWPSQDIISKTRAGTRQY